MAIPVMQVDAFTREPYRGNPAAVCFPASPLADDRMQDIAREMNLSETAFLFRRPDGWDLRWFTPQVEVDLCGHATLAAAHALWESGRLASGETARFHTRSGWLTAQSNGEWIEMDFPAGTVREAAAPDKLERALGARMLQVCHDGSDYVIEVESAAIVRSLQPDLQTLAAIPARGFAVTSRSDDPRWDFISRFFAPAVGIPEDPVTGSAHCSLGPYWSKTMGGKTEFTAWQASARGGAVRLRLAGSRVALGGQAVTVLRGELL